MEELHSLLRRQLKRYYGEALPDTPECHAFLRAVSDVYRDFDIHRELNERALVLSSEELHQANDEMRAIFQAMPDLLFRLDQQGTILDFKAGTADDLLRPARELIGKKFQNLPGRPIRRRFGEAVRKVAAENTAVTIEYSLTVKGGENVYEARLVPLPKAQIVVIIRNVTERKRAEEDLFQSRQMLRTVLDTIPTRIFWKDRNSVYLGCNQPFAEDCGYSNPGELIGKTDYETASAALADQYRADDLQVMESGRPKLNYEEPQVDAADRQRWLLTSKAPLYDQEGRVIGILGTYDDITEKRKLEEQLRQSQKMEAVGQLSGGIAHDFNNLLTIIRGHVSLMEFSSTLPEDLRDSVAEIRVASERAANLTRQLLAFSRRQRIHPATLDLNEAVSNMTRMLHRILGEDIAMQMRCAPQPAMIHADVGMMEQVLMNLVVNARDAMPRGGRLMIQTANTVLNPDDLAGSPKARPGEFVCLTVSDTGVGIAPEVMPRIFEPFFTTKDVGKGTGLGLATVYGIVEQHHGWITAESEPGKGATFRVYLPRSEKPAAAADAAKTLSSSPGGGETILVAEDEDSVRALVKSILTQKGYRVLLARSGVQALEIWRQHRNEIQLLLTDMVMPDGINGRELSEQLLREKPGLKVIYASGYSADVVGQDFVLEEGVNFLAKPFNPLKLAQVVRARLDDRPVAA